MRLAIVIPTLNEEAALAQNLEAARSVADILVVADGGSNDRSLELAIAQGAQTVVSEPSRGLQLRSGAQLAIAQGATVLLFLHADTLLPDDCRRRIRHALDNGAIGGGFSIRFDDPRCLFRVGSGIVNLRTRIFRMPLGDQAQFVLTTVYEELGGFADWPILEDLDFMRRLNRRGPLNIVRAPVLTQARRFQERGILRTVATNWLIWFLFLVGVKPERLARLYRREW